MPEDNGDPLNPASAAYVGEAELCPECGAELYFASVAEDDEDELGFYYCVDCGWEQD